MDESQVDTLFDKKSMGMKVREFKAKIMSNVQETSISAYRDLNLNKQEKEVMRAFLTLGESCVADVARFLGWEKSTVAGRINMLKTPVDEKGKGKLECSGKRVSKTTGIRSLFYKIKEI